MSSLAARLHAALPQTQCTRCGYPDCAAYAQAMADSVADINRCPPGGAEGVERLAALTGRPIVPLEPACGAESPRQVAVIDEAWCIGCTLCQPVCPTDAIVGANKRMHTVIEVHCTGCELCLPACPVDCISLENVSGTRTGWQAWSPQQAAQALVRYEAHQQRTQLDSQDGAERPASAPAGAGASPSQATGQHAADNEAPSSPTEAERKRAAVQAALARARARTPR